MFLVVQNGKEHAASKYAKKAAARERLKRKYIAAKRQGCKSASKFVANQSAKGGHFEPHLGAEFVDHFMNHDWTQNAMGAMFAACFGEANAVEDRIWSELEKAFSLFHCMREAQTVSQAYHILFLYAKTHYRRSIVIQFSKALNELIFYSAQGSDDDPKWLQAIRNFELDWRTLKDGPIFNMVSKIVSIVVSLGLCEFSQIDFTVGGFHLFSQESIKKQLGAVDIIDAAISTVKYFVESGYECFKQRSLKPFLYADTALQKAEEEFLEVVHLSDYAFVGNLEKHKNMSENDYDKKLEKCIDDTKALLQAAKTTFEKKLFTDRIGKLNSIKAKFGQTRVSGGLRIAPFCVELYGKSGVGKSTLSNLTMVSVLKMNGFDASDDRLMTYNSDDKYMSTAKGFIEGIFFDDFGNTKPNFVEQAPSKSIINMVNNVKYYANMADVDSKGKISLEPKCVCITTNKLDLDSFVYSVYPFSINRRAHVVVEVKVKPDYADSNGMLDSNAVYSDPNINPTCPDVWNISLWDPVDKGPNAGVTFTPIVYQGVEMTDIGIKDYMFYLKRESGKHFSNQKKLVENSRNLADRLAFCEKCSLPTCICVPLEKQDGVLADLSSVMDESEKIISKLDAWYFRLIPDCVMYKYSCYLSYKLGYMFFRNVFCSFILLCLISLILGVSLKNFVFASLPFLFLIEVKLAYDDKLSILLSKINSTRGSYQLIADARKNFNVAYFAATAGVTYGLYKLCNFVRTYRLVAQGNIAPTSQKDIMERDSEKNPWLNVKVEPIPSTVIGGHTVDQLQDIVFRNLAYTRIFKGEDVHFCNALFLKSNVALIPKHMWLSGTMDVEFVRHDPASVGGNFKTRLFRVHSVSIPDTDLSLVYVPAGGDWKDITVYFNSEVPKEKSSVHCKMVYKNRTAEFVGGSVYPKCCWTGNDVAKFYGATYNLPFNSFNGLCMATFVADVAQPFIFGFHLGGNTGGPQGCCGIVTKRNVLDAINMLEERPSVYVSSSSGIWRDKQLGKEVLPSRAVSKYSPVNFMEGPAHLKVFGSTNTRSKMKTDVVPTVISNDIAEVFERPNIWAGPKFKGPDGKTPWLPWRTSLVQSVKPMKEFNGAILDWAFKDYVEPLLPLLDQYISWGNIIRPLSEVETVSGIDGMRFIDPMVFTTSMGYPLSGPKSEHIVHLEPTETHACPRTFTQEIWDEVYECEDIYARGERCYGIFKACLKDEPTKKSRDKVRVFQAAPLVLQLLTRKYFLTIMRFLSVYPLESECAVGVNAQGPEWTALAEHVAKFGKENILAGDYAHFDKNGSCQILLAAMKIFHVLASRSGNYSERDLTIMRGIATDTVYFMCDYDGTMVSHMGSWPSGTNLTVYGNSGRNALEQRCCFFTYYDPRVYRFRDYVAAITYGDDLVGSVHDSIKNYDHIIYAKFQKDHGGEFTMPDKESTPIPLMKLEDVDFLKRRFVWNEEVGQYMGPLSEDSIFKMLHTVVKSSAVSLTEQSLQNMDTALREWFFHGREIFEDRRAKLRVIAERHNAVDQVPYLSLDYDTAMAQWKEKYLGFEKQSGVEHKPDATDFKPYEYVPYTESFAWESYTFLPMLFLLFFILWCEPIFVVRRPYWRFPCWFRFVVALHFGSLLSMNDLTGILNLILRDISMGIFILYLKFMAWVIRLVIES